MGIFWGHLGTIHSSSLWPQVRASTKSSGMLRLELRERWKHAWLRISFSNFISSRGISKSFRRICFRLKLTSFWARSTAGFVCQLFWNPSVCSQLVRSFVSRGTDPWRTQLRKVPTESRDPEVFVEVRAVQAMRAVHNRHGFPSQMPVTPCSCFQQKLEKWW